MTNFEMNQHLFRVTVRPVYYSWIFLAESEYNLTGEQGQELLRDKLNRIFETAPLEVQDANAETRIQFAKDNYSHEVNAEDIAFIEKMTGRKIEVKTAPSLDDIMNDDLLSL